MKKTITTVLPISRIEYLDRVIDSLLAQTYKPNNLFVIFDGDEEKFLDVRNRIVGLPFDSVRVAHSYNLTPAYTIPDRRRHISNIHNQFRDNLENTDLIFSIEDDGILPTNALEKLLDAYLAHDKVGMVTGVELGRWGVPYVGAWYVNDINNPTIITSLENKTAEQPTKIEPIDACGLYCALIDAEQYKKHKFHYYNGLGPDVNLGIFLRQQGFNNFIDWGIPVTHLTEIDGEQKQITAFDKSRVVKLQHLSDDIWSATH